MPRTRAQLLREFIAGESAAGIGLIAAAIVAIVIANSALAEVYRGWLAFPVAVSAGALTIDKPLILWINDGLMALFFFLVGLEVKREIVNGQLSSWKQASMPVYAAIGGMAVPALIFLAINADKASNLDGWAIPAATDIAFALGLLALLGSRVPVALKALLLAVAIIDDIGAIAIIALFYTAELKVDMLLYALLPLAGLYGLNRAGIARTIPYLLFTAILWVFTLKSGVHATLAGVAAAMFVPLNAHGEQPLARFEHGLHPWVSFGVLPIFAFANAGVSFAGVSMADLFAPLSLGIAAGLVVGKQLGIFGACWLAVKLGFSSLPRGLGWKPLYGLSCLAGIGFTMSLFIGGLAFDDAAKIDSVKLGVLSGSLISALIGMTVLVLSLPKVAKDPAY